MKIRIDTLPEIHKKILNSINEIIKDRWKYMSAFSTINDLEEKELDKGWEDNKKIVEEYIKHDVYFHVLIDKLNEIMTVINKNISEEHSQRVNIHTYSIAHQLFKNNELLCCQLKICKQID